MNKKEASIHFRCPADVRDEVEQIVATGAYKDVSEYMLETLLLRLRPESMRKQMVDKIKYYLQNDPEIRKELDLD